MTKLLDELKNYISYDETEKQNVAKTIAFLQSNKNAFERSNLLGHFTAGGLVGDMYGNVLLNHHKKANIWIQFGGHADGDKNIKRVSLREVYEECGIKDFCYASNNIFDVDVQYIPDNINKGEPAHYHYDINYLYIVDTHENHISNESLELRWVSVDEAKQLAKPDDKGMQRMLNKYELFLQNINSKTIK